MKSTMKSACVVLFLLFVSSALASSTSMVVLLPYTSNACTTYATATTTAPLWAALLVSGQCVTLTHSAGGAKYQLTSVATSSGSTGTATLTTCTSSASDCSDSSHCTSSQTMAYGAATLSAQCVSPDTTNYFRAFLVVSNGTQNWTKIDTAVFTSDVHSSDPSGIISVANCSTGTATGFAVENIGTANTDASLIANLNLAGASDFSYATFASATTGGEGFAFTPTSNCIQVPTSPAVNFQTYYPPAVVPGGNSSGNSSSNTTAAPNATTSAPTTTPNATASPTAKATTAPTQPPVQVAVSAAFSFNGDPTTFDAQGFAEQIAAHFNATDVTATIIPSRRSVKSAFSVQVNMTLPAASTSAVPSQSALQSQMNSVAQTVAASIGGVTYNGVSVTSYTVTKNDSAGSFLFASGLSVFVAACVLLLFS